MVKAYLRYEARDAWGVISTTNCNIAFDATGKLLFTGCLENVGVWNVKQGALVRLPGPLRIRRAARCIV